MATEQDGLHGEAGDDHGVAYVVVEAAEAEVRQCAEAGGAQVVGLLPVS
ncbi:hypothetical protein ACFVHS_35725 [Streptomyces sp. NPDC057746]